MTTTSERAAVVAAESRFTEQNIVVVGGASGIGGEVASALAQAGATVDVLDRVERPQEEKITTSVVDVRDRDAVAAALAAVVERRTSVDGVVYAAGVLDGYATLEEISPELMDVVLDVNCVGAVNVLQQVVPTMKTAGYGRIVLFGSIAGIVAGAGGIAYTMSKHAVAGLVKHLAVELGPYGITTNSVAPGSIQGTKIRTSITAITSPGSVATDRGLGVMSAEDAAKTYPVGRLGTIDAVVPTVLHLLDRSSWFINGAEVAIDGGFTSK
ncbi:SDR family NAD(P)-dependent oxidoreductase [Georgenia subflava]|uniref:SDR family NAD(P)-dependent oxidoreductase n=1 Tax=Georgenia subflava TaxID=1622177 RepID=UPI00186B3595|nr:SDR family oxidoreductase [Georgenia subflava]